MILSIILGGFLLIYTIIYTYNRVKLIYTYKNAKALNEIQTIEGYVCGKFDEEAKRIQGVLVNMAYPKYCYIIDDKKCYHQGSVKFQDVTIGETVKIDYCERTGKVWVQREMPLIKQNLLIRIPKLLFLIALLIITETVL